MITLNNVIQGIKMHHILNDNPLEPLFFFLYFFIITTVFKFPIILFQSIFQKLNDKSHRMVMIFLQIL